MPARHDFLVPIQTTGRTRNLCLQEHQTSHQTRHTNAQKSLKLPLQFFVTVPYAGETSFCSWRVNFECRNSANHFLSEVSRLAAYCRQENLVMRHFITPRLRWSCGPVPVRCWFRRKKTALKTVRALNYCQIYLLHLCH